MKHTAVVVAICATLLAGCATAPTPLATPSGNPEITVAASRSEVSSGILAVLADVGVAHETQVVQDTPSSFVVQWPNRDFWSNVFYASQYDLQSYVRFSVRIIEQEGKLRLLGSVAAVTNPNSGFEHVKPLNDQNSRTSAQTILDRLAEYLQKQQARGI